MFVPKIGKSDPTFIETIQRLINESTCSVPSTIPKRRKIKVEKKNKPTEKSIFHFLETMQKSYT